MSFHKLIVAVLAAMVLAVPATAAAAPQDRSDAARTFLRAATQGNLFEVASGKVARTRGQTEAVRDLGALLVADHSAELTRLRALASRLDVRLPRRPNAAQRQQIAALKGAPPAAFDQAFLAGQRAAHIESIGIYKIGALAGPRSIRVSAVNTLPVLGEHLGVVRLLLGEHSQH
jgi:putative membrane protein